MQPELGITWIEQALVLPIILMDQNMDDTEVGKFLIIICLN